MKRYCILNTTDKCKFQSEDIDVYYSIDLDSLIQANMISTSQYDIKAVQELIENNLTCRQIESDIRKIPFFDCFKLDIINEIYLAMICMKNEKAKFYLGDDDIDAKMRETVGNRSRKTDKCKPFFDIQEYKSTSKEMEVPKFGLALIRFWFWSKEFRNLLLKRERATDIYETNTIIKNIEENKLFNEKNSYISEIDAILLERILGVSLEFAFNRNIYEIEKDAQGKLELGEDKELINLMENIQQYHGEYSRIAISQLIGINLWNLKRVHRKKTGKKAIEECAMYVKEYAKEYNQIYTTVCEKMIEEYSKRYSLETAIKRLEDKKKIIELSYIGIANGFTEQMRRNDMEELSKIIIKNVYDEKVGIRDNAISVLTEFLLRFKGTEGKVKRLYFENDKNSWQRDLIKEEFSSDTLLKKVQKVIIEGNLRRYNK